MPGPAGRAAGTWRLGAFLTLIAGLVPTAALAWPAVQDSSGVVYFCDSRPEVLPDGQWRCRSAGGTAAGTLIEVVRPGMPPGARPYGYGRTPGPPSRYGYGTVPWGPPPREPSGYDALDPWLGQGGPER